MLRGYITGVLLSGTVVFLVAIAQAGPPNYCGKDQDGPVCLQQWVTALGPAVALLFAGYGAIQVRNQLRQGQSAVVATQRQQLRHEYETLATIREDLAQKQRDIEAYDSLYRLRGSLPPSTNWHQLEEMQFKFDGFVEWLADVAREPYLYNRRTSLTALNRRAFKRAECFRRLAARWDYKTIQDSRMAEVIYLTRALSVRDMETLRLSIDRVVVRIAERLASLSEFTLPDDNEKV